MIDNGLSPFIPAAADNKKPSMVVVIEVLVGRGRYFNTCWLARRATEEGRTDEICRSDRVVDQSLEMSTEGTGPVSLLCHRHPERHGYIRNLMLLSLLCQMQEKYSRVTCRLVVTSVVLHCIVLQQLFKGARPVTKILPGIDDVGREVGHRETVDAAEKFT